MPADAAQARLAAQILIVRELADTIAARAYAPELTVAQMCRVGRAAAELVRTATGLVRALAREQQKPAAFFGTVLADAVDVAALDAVWGNNPMHREAAPTPAAAGKAGPAGDVGPAPAGGQADAAPAAAAAGVAPAVTSRPAGSGLARTQVPAWRGRVVDAACPPAGADVPAHAAGRDAAPRPAA